MSKFFGVLGPQPIETETREEIIKKAVKASFGYSFFFGHTFDLCAIHYLQEFDYTTFADWARRLHVAPNLDPITIRKLKLYCVNYFLCPKATTLEEVEHKTLEIFPNLNRLSFWEKLRYKYGPDF